MNDDAGASILIVEQGVTPGFVDGLCQLLIALFPASVIECVREATAQDELSAARVPHPGHSESVAVLLGHDPTWFAAVRTRWGLPGALCIRFPKKSKKSSTGDPPLNDPCFLASDPSALEELIGHLAQRTRLTRPLDIGAHRSKIAELADFAYSESGAKKADDLRKLVLVGCLSGIAVLGVVGRVYWTRIVDIAVTERFGFEHDIAPWMVQTTREARGCVNVKQAVGVSKAGERSLEVVVDLDPAAGERKSGEVWADLNHMVSANNSAPLDLGGHKAVAWVKASAGAMGDAKRPNGFQLYVKDRHWKSCYGKWVDASAGEWQRLVLEVGEEGSGQHLDPGFDEHAVAAIGIKIAVPRGATAKSAGSVYVDSIGW